MSKSSPAPPDPVSTSKAQYEYNKEAAYDSAKLNQINQYTPWGDLSYTGDIGSPNRTQHVNLSPSQRGLFDSSNWLKQGLINSVLPGHARQGGSRQDLQSRGGDTQTAFRGQRPDGPILPGEHFNRKNITDLMAAGRQPANFVFGGPRAGSPDGYRTADFQDANLDGVDDRDAPGGNYYESAPPSNQSGSAGGRYQPWENVKYSRSTKPWELYTDGKGSESRNWKYTNEQRQTKGQDFVPGQWRLRGGPDRSKWGQYTGGIDADAQDSGQNTQFAGPVRAETVLTGFRPCSAYRHSSIEATGTMEYSRAFSRGLLRPKQSSARW